MSLTDNALSTATCTNIPDCGKAVASEQLDWYPGAGEYCPECGEALAPLASRSLAAASSASASPPSESPSFDSRASALPASESPVSAAPLPAPADVQTLENTGPDTSARSVDIRRPIPPRRHSRLWSPLRWFWVVVAAFVAGGAIFYTQGRAGRAVGTARSATNLIAVCPIASAQQLAADLVRGYAVKSATPASRFVVTNANTCNVRFSTAAEPPNTVIAHDAIVAIVNPLNPIPRVSEKQLREIFSGSIRDWSQVGGQRGAIVPVLPDSASDEGKVLASSLFFGVRIDPGVRQGGSSADVTRAVTGADRTSRDAIGLVAFSQAVPAKIVPLAYLPSPSVLSIATGRYPYSLTVAIEPASAHGPSIAQSFIDYARSGDGAAIVAKNGLVTREGR